MVALACGLAAGCSPGVDEVPPDAAGLSDADATAGDLVAGDGDADVAAPGDVSAVDGAADATLAADSSASCPGPEKPGPDTFVLDAPQPSTATCTWEDPAFFKGAKPPPQFLDFEVGTVDKAGKFIVYADGDWVPMVHGTQGGFHVWAALHLKVPGTAVAKLKLQVEPILWDGCMLAGFGYAPTVYALPQPDGSYLLGDSEAPGTRVFFTGAGGQEVKSATSVDFCNRWMDLRVSAREMLPGGQFGAWGKRTVRVRTYDQKTKPK